MEGRKERHKRDGWPEDPAKRGPARESATGQALASVCGQSDLNRVRVLSRRNARSKQDLPNNPVDIAPEHNK